MAQASQRAETDIARLDNQVVKLGSSPAIKNKLATLSNSELTWILFDTS
jgi:hypothetical protein